MVPRVEQEWESGITFLDPIAYAASTDPDVLYLHEALKQPDRKEFLKVMIKEVAAHTESKNWIVINKNAVPTQKARTGL